MPKEQTLLRSQHVRILDITPPDTIRLAHSRRPKATKAEDDNNVPAETLGTKQWPVCMGNRRRQIVFEQNIISGTFPGDIFPYKKIVEIGYNVITQTPNQLIKRFI